MGRYRFLAWWLLAEIKVTPADGFAFNIGLRLVPWWPPYALLRVLMWAVVKEVRHG